MRIGHLKVRKLFTDFWIARNHKEVPPIPLVPKDDPTTLFTGSGMQQFVPNLLGEPHPQGTLLFNVQPCFRAQDIEEVGDNRHTTGFEMMGNWSLGQYFKREQLNWFFEFLTDKVHGLGINPERLFVTAFEGNQEIPQDSDSVEIWKNIFKKAGLVGEIGRNIFLYPASKNWWSRDGVPQNMSAGEPGGPDSEVFFQFDTPHDPAFGDNCHPNCDCGKFLEIGNSVFMQYRKLEDGSFEELPQKNVDFGGGLERLLAAANDDPDVFNSDIYSNIIKKIEKISDKSYEENKKSIRVVADHLKTAVFLIKDGVRPSNKEQGYILRRLLRRSLLKMNELMGELPPSSIFDDVAAGVIEVYDKVYFDKSKDLESIRPILKEEVVKFEAALKEGLRQINKIDKIDGKLAFDLYQSYGFPVEMTAEIFEGQGQKIDMKSFTKEFDTHKDRSRSTAANKFKGGLADKSEQVVRYHTATHLLHQALQDILGPDAKQEGSNITGERLRFDFYSATSPTEADIQQVEKIVNDKIKADLPSTFVSMDKDKAFALGAKAFFKHKYADTVSVAFIGGGPDNPQDSYSIELCGGPHIGSTGEIGKIEIFKFKKIGSNLYRVYAK